MQAQSLFEFAACLIKSQRLFPLPPPSHRYALQAKQEIHLTLTFFLQKNQIEPDLP